MEAGRGLAGRGRRPRMVGEGGWDVSKLRCRACGSNDLVIRSEFLVCQRCGVKYDVYAAKEMAFDAVYGESDTGANGSYIVEGILKRYRGCSGTIVVPHGVTTIGKSAFEDSTAASVIIPEGVTTIGDSAFRDCASLTSISIPSSVTSIGDNAFERCTALASVFIPSGVTSIGAFAFRGCRSLRSITIPDGVTHIAEHAFGGCELLSSVTFPRDLTSIGKQAFTPALRYTGACVLFPQPVLKTAALVVIRPELSVLIHER